MPNDDYFELYNSVLVDLFKVDQKVYIVNDARMVFILNDDPSPENTQRTILDNLLSQIGYTRDNIRQLKKNQLPTYTQFKHPISVADAIKKSKGFKNKNISNLSISLLNPKKGDIIHINDSHMPRNIVSKRRNQEFIFSEIKADHQINKVLNKITFLNESEEANDDVRVLEIAAASGDETQSIYVPFGFIENQGHLQDTDQEEIVLTPKNGTIIFNDTGSVSYLPAESSFINDSFSFITLNKHGDDGLATIFINPQKDSANTSFEEATTLAASCIIGKDTFDFYIVEEPNQGTLSFNRDGSFSYSPISQNIINDAFLFAVKKNGNLVNIVKVEFVYRINKAAFDLENDESISSTQAISSIGIMGSAGMIGVSSLGTQGKMSMTSHSNSGSGTNQTHLINPLAHGTVGPTFGSLAAHATPPSPTAATVVPPLILPNVALSGNENTPAVFTETQLVGTLGTTPGVSLVILQQPANGTVALGPNGTLIYSPHGNYFGPDSFTIEVINGTQTSNPITVTVNIAQAPPVVQSVNDPNPVAEANAPVTNSTFFLPVTDVNNHSTVNVLQQPAHGTITINPNGTFTFTQDPNHIVYGQESFTYQAVDNGVLSNVGTITFNITQAAPIVQSVADPNPLGEVNSPVSDSTFVLPVSDINNNSTLQVVQQPAYGTITINSNGTFTFTQDPNHIVYGQESFTYQAVDNGVLSNIGTVTFNITQAAPVVQSVADPNPLAEVNAPVSDSTFILPVSDINNNSTLQVVQQPAYGTITINPNGTFTFTQDPNHFVYGQESFTYQAVDNGVLSNIGTVTFNITQAAPVVQSVTDPNPLAEVNAPVSDSTFVLPVSDINNNSTLQVVQQPAYGTITINPNGTFTFTQDPNHFVYGQESFTYQAVDNGVLSNIGTVTFNITQAAPVVQSVTDPNPLAEVNAPVSDSTFILPVSDINNNSTLQVVQQPAYGTITINPNGTFTFTQDPNHFVYGQESFTYQAVDNGVLSNIGTVNFNITQAAPVVQSVTDPNPLAEVNAPVSDSTFILPVSDINNNSTLQVVQQPAYGTITINPNGTFTFTQDPNHFVYGQESFTYQAVDNGVLSNIGTVNFNITQAAPVVQSVTDPNPLAEVNAPVSDSAFILPVSDINNNSTLQVVQQPAYGTITINPNGTFTFTQDPNHFVYGQETFTYQAVDNGVLSNIGTVTFNITQAAPVVQSVTDPNPLAEVNAPVSESTFFLPVSDINNHSTLQVVQQPAYGTITINPNGTFTFTQDPNHIVYGQESFTYQAVDNGVLSNVGTVTFNITQAAPVVQSVTDPNPLAEVYAPVSESTFFLPVSDINNNSVLQVVQQPAYGTITINPNGTFTFTQDPNHIVYGQESFTYQAVDNGVLSNVGTVTFNITQAAPIASNETYYANENASLSINSTSTGVLSGVIDINNNSTVSVVPGEGPSHGTLTLNPNGTFTYTPNANYAGTDSFTYIATDGSVTSAPAIVTFDINAVANTPQNTTGSLNSFTDIAYTVADIKGVSGDPTELFSYNFSTGVTSAIGPLEGTKSGIDIESLTTASNGLLYGVEVVGFGAHQTSVLVQINPLTGAMTNVSLTNPPGDFSQIQVIEAVGNSLIIGTESGNSTHFYSLSLSNNSIQDLGSFAGNVTGLAYDPVHNLLYGSIVEGNHTTLDLINNLISNSNPSDITITPVLGTNSQPISLVNGNDGLSFTSDGMIASFYGPTGDIIFTNPATGFQTVIHSGFADSQFASSGGGESLAVGSVGDGQYVFDGSSFSISFSATFSDFTNGTESHNFFIQIPSAAWAVAGETVVTNPAGLPAGTYVEVSAAPLINPSTGIADATYALNAPADLVGSPGFEAFTLNVYAVSSQSPGYPGENLADNIAYQVVPVTVDVISGTSILVGTPGEANLVGSNGNDLIIASTGTENITGGPGSDVMVAGAGVDTFIFNSGDQGTTAQPAVDTIVNFQPAIDHIDLSGMLVGETSSNIQNYLNVTFSGGNSTISVSPNGDGHVQEVIVVHGVDLTGGLNTATMQSTILTNLVNAHEIVTHHNG